MGRPSSPRYASNPYARMSMHTVASLLVLNSDPGCLRRLLALRSGAHI